MLELIKKRCGIAAAVKVYDDDIEAYMEDCKADLILSGVEQSLVDNEHPGVITAMTFYIKAHLGNDRTDTEKYMRLYHDKVFRLTLEDAIVAPEQQEEDANVE